MSKNLIFPDCHDPNCRWNKHKGVFCSKCIEWVETNYPIKDREPHHYDCNILSSDEYGVSKEIFFDKLQKVLDEYDNNPLKATPPTFEVAGDFSLCLCGGLLKTNNEQLEYLLQHKKRIDHVKINGLKLKTKRMEENKKIIKKLLKDKELLGELGIEIINKRN